METRTPLRARAQAWKERLERRPWVVLARETALEFADDKVPRLAAAMAYYTLFSLAPLLVIALAVAGFVFGPEASQGQLAQALEGLLGPQGAAAVQEMVARAHRPGAGLVATALGAAALLFGASGVFAQLHAALDTIWDVEPRKGGGIRGFLKHRFLAFVMVVGVGFLLLVSLVATALLSAMGDLLAGALPGGGLLWQAVNLLVSLAATVLLFALLLKVVPDVRIAWRDALVGGALTALLFAAGKHAVGLYLGRSAVGSVYGAAGSLVAILVWVYYSALIFFLGAEFTQVYARTMGRGWRLGEGAARAGASRGGKRRGRSGA